MSDKETHLKSPKFIIIADRTMSPTMCERFKAIWNEAAEAGKPIVLDGGFKVFAVNSEGQWSLLDSSTVIP